jgi:hypothetical protein
LLVVSTEISKPDVSENYYSYKPNLSSIFTLKDSIDYSLYVD